MRSAENRWTPKDSLVLWIVTLTLLVCSGTSSAQSTDNGYRLQRDASYFVVAPRRIRPNEVVQLSVSVLRLYYNSINVRAVIRRDHEELASAQHLFTQPGTQMLQMLVPLNAQAGNYSLRVEGSANAMSSGYIFENETKLIFDAKQISLFIQTCKELYRQGQTVLFRLFPIEPNLMSRSGSMDVYIIDSSGTTVRRWLSLQTNAGGVLDMAFQLSEQPRYGEWKIRAKAWGYWYEKTFQVHEFWITMLDVNVTMPFHIMDDEYGLAGLVVTNLTLGQPTYGTMKVKVEVRLPQKLRDPNVDYVWPTLEQGTRIYHGTADVLFSLDDLRALIPGTDKNRLANRELYVEAEVYDWTQDLTATGFAICVVYSADVDLVLLGDPSRTFKPNQTMHVYYAVVNKDGSRLDRNRRQITVTGTEKLRSGRTLTFEHKFLVGSDGIGRYSYTPSQEAQIIQIQAMYDEYGSAVDLVATRHYTPTGSYITINSPTIKPRVDEYMVFTVTTNTRVDQVFYVITAGGNIITGGTLLMTSRQKSFSIALSRDMIPQAHVVVWHVYQDEVISDSMNFYVNGTRINKVSMKFNRGKDFSGDTVEMNTQADPSSYVGYSGMEHELYAYGWHSFITEPDIIKELSTYDSHINSSFQFEWRLREEQQELVFFPSPTYGIDANTTFEYAGLVVFTDANVTRIPHDCNETLGWFPCMDGSCYFHDQKCDRVKQCQDGQDEMGCVFPVEDPFTPTRERLHLLARHYYQTAEWIWGGHFAKPDGRLDMKLYPTDEALPWILSGFSISKDLGFGIVHDHPRHQGTRSFFIRLEVPETNVKKGEQIAVKIVLFNFWMQDLECILTLHGSDDYKFVIVEDYGIVRSYNPRLRSGDIQTMVYMPQGHVTQIRFPVLPTVESGCVTVRVSAIATLYKDIEEIDICVEFDGVTNYLHTPYFLDLISSGSMILPDLAVPVPERFIKPQERQHLYVPGSPQSSLGVVGDVVGGGLVQPVTVEEALRKPYGAAEQNMYNFAYSLYNLKYLKATNQLSQTVLKRTLSLMNVHLQRQTGYLNDDGSFSMFRDYQTHTPSTWLTSYCLRVLTDANEKDWELDFFIEVDLLNEMMLWLCRQQDTASGAFTETAPLYDRKMWSNDTIVGGEYRKSNFSLTAYVLITLVKSVRVTGDAEICKTLAVQKAQSYLERHLAEISDTYTVAITAYVLQLVGSSVSTQAYRKLEDLKISGQEVYWANKPIPANEVRIIDTIPYYQPRRIYDNEAYAVEATSYALMTYLLRNQWLTAGPIMKWLQTMRNSFYGQASTQDSIVALMALVEYAKLDTNRALYNIELSIDLTAAGNASEKMKMSKVNWPDLQLKNVYPVWGSVRGRAQGTGLALMQLATQVNVEYPHQILPAPEGNFFEIEISALEYTGKNFSNMFITPCVRWVRPDISPISGLAVMEVHVPTGYVITNDLLRALAQSEEIPNLRRAEQTGRKLIFYFDYLDTTRTCVQTRLERWYPTANMTIQHLLRVFDYYEPGMHNTTLYTTWALFNLHVCQVCASFQCPYCLWYNAAPPSPPAPNMAALLALAALSVVAAFARTIRD